jgi:hypothetical protein
MIKFKIPEQIIGFSTNTAKPGEMVNVQYIEAITSLDPMLTWRLEELHNCIFHHIPKLIIPSQIDNLLLIIKPDLTAVAYINEIIETATVKAARAIKKGQNVFANDIKDIISIDLGIEIPKDCALVIIRSFGWRKSLFYDFGPLLREPKLRNYEIQKILAKQALELIQGKFSEIFLEGSTDINNQSIAMMKLGLAELRNLIDSNCEEEAKYQELLQNHSWILGASYKSIDRHTRFNDEHIPDFTGIRNHDGFRDIIELKQPFMPCFRQDGEFSSQFNESWNQAERYLVFSRRERDYLRSQKGLLFENPKCFLLLGRNLTENQIRMIKDKESLNPAITILTYDQLILLGEFIINLIEKAFS